jgi:alcohol dehydrogenase
MPTSFSAADLPSIRRKRRTSSQRRPVLDFEESGNVPNAPQPSVFVPTTVGTGSEVGHWIIVKDVDTSIEEEIGDVSLLADLALIDPELTASAPAPVKAATDMDVLTHAIEAYVSIEVQSQTSALALDPVEKVGTYLPRAVEYRGDDREALSTMAKANSQAGMAFNETGLGAGVRIPETLAERDAVPELAEQATRDGSLTGNPRVTDADGLATILHRAFDGRFETRA